MVGVLQRLLLGCCGPQCCHRHAVPFLEVSKFLTRFLTAVLKIYIDWLVLFSAWCPTEMPVLSMCVVHLSASVSVQFGHLPPYCNRPDREAQDLWDTEGNRILWKQVAGYWRGSGCSLQGTVVSVSLGDSKRPGDLEDPRLSYSTSHRVY